MSAVQRVYRLLRLYPAALRDDCERELTLLFQEQLEMERTPAGRCA